MATKQLASNRLKAAIAFIAHLKRPVAGRLEVEEGPEGAEEAVRVSEGAAVAEGLPVQRGREALVGHPKSLVQKDENRKPKLTVLPRLALQEIMIIIIIKHTHKHTL